MRSFLATVVLALVFGVVGGVGSRYLGGGPATVALPGTVSDGASPRTGPADDDSAPALRLARLDSRIATLEAQVAQLVQRQRDVTREAVTGDAAASVAGVSPPLSEREALLLAGVHPDTADEILGRLSRREFRKLELQNLIRRRDIPDKRAYIEELSELNREPLSLRTELGDEAYDSYLLARGQPNRVQVASVMPGSPAEANGIHAGDIILRYGGAMIFTWQDLHEATTGGAFGSFANIELERDGIPMNIVVPRGVLGVRAEAIRSTPGRP
jgi:membrane-associated protease RseP (regulator of RpoE activity)